MNKKYNKRILQQPLRGLDGFFARSSLQNRRKCGRYVSEKTMTQVLEEVETAIKRLGLEREVIRVPDVEERDLFNDLLDTFVEGGDRRWWWESFRSPSESVEFKDSKGFERLTNIVPDSKEIVWFVIEDDHREHYPIFQSSTENAVKIIGDCFGYEYYLVSKDKKWLLCENHHNYIIGVGNSVVSAIQRVAT